MSLGHRFKHYHHESPLPATSDITSTFSRSLLHKWSTSNSILCLVPSPKRKILFCGTQDSTIIVYDLVTFQKKIEFTAHQGSILSLHLSKCEDRLFSSGSDSLVNIWQINDEKNDNLISFKLTHTVYSLQDIGDIFSLNWNENLQLLFFGAQNATISFVHIDLSENSYDLNDHYHLIPSQRFDRFFNSKGFEIHSNKYSDLPKPMKLIQVPSENVIDYAHYGFVYALDSLCNLDPMSCTLGESITDKYTNILISGGGDGLIKFWGITSNGLEFVKSLKNNNCVLSITIDPITLKLYAGLGAGEATIWDLTTFQILKILNVGNLKDKVKHDVFAVGLTPLKNILLMGTHSGITKQLLSSTIGANEKNLSVTGGDTGGIIRITNNSCLTLKTFESNGESYLVAAGSDKTVSLWSIESLVPCSTPRINSPAIYDDPFSNEKFFKTLSELISFRTVSQQPDLFKDDCRQCANYLSVLLRSFGATSQLWPVENGNPIVYAHFKANSSNADSPTIAWYAHYDVIPASHKTWKTSPFELIPENGYLYGRGVTDNKGPLLAAIYSVAELYSKKQLNANVIFIIEGEEEAGSWGLSTTLKSKVSEGLIDSVDWILMSNSYWLDDDVPCLNYGLRGVVKAEVEIWNDLGDRHAGVDGGLDDEPSMDLIKVCSGLVEKGVIKVDGFDVSQLDNDLLKSNSNKLLPDLSNLDKETREIINNLPNWEQPLYAQIAIQLPHISIKSLLKKWREPSLSLHRIEMSGPNNGTVIPSKALAKLSVRLVPGQDVESVKKSLSEALVNRFNLLKSSNHINVRFVHEADPWIGDVSNEMYCILEKLLKDEWKMDPLFIREGGSIPAIRLLETLFNAKAAHLPMGQSSDNAHLNNERIRVVNLLKSKNIIKNIIKNVNKAKQNN
ncbi:glutamine amidotransferase subunit [Martiniozyma asiatica (nom. inval.)]|nr:glutamine amidotransferase subunit [Martiniozyma asiatica]